MNTLSNIWNAQYVGQFDIKRESTYELTFDDNIYIVATRTSNANLVALIDEIKCLFDLPKHGTLRINIKNKLTLIYPLYNIDNNIVTLDKLDITKLDNNAKDELKRWIVFHELICATYNNNLFYIDDHIRCYPEVCYYDKLESKSSNFIAGQQRIKLAFGSDAEYVKWAGNYLSKIVNSDFWNKFEATIKRIDKRLIWFKSLIEQRITLFEDKIHDNININSICKVINKIKIM